jgi:pimeloyl-ACP methyl ester carboxylesterase
MNERAFLFGRAATLLGIVTDPQPSDAGRSGPGILLLNAGLLPREGPNRLYVKLGRALARRGHQVLRFDFSGIGDSATRLDNVPYEERPVVETQAAMDCLAEYSGTKQHVLIGVCTGADAALQTAYRDPRVVGAVLINPTEFRRREAAMPVEPTITEELTARAGARIRMRYYTRRMLDLQSWIRFIRGRSDRRAIVQTLRTLIRKGRGRVDSARPAALDCWRLLERGADLLIVFSEGSAAWDLFELCRMEPILRSLVPTPGQLRVERILNTDHIFTPLHSQKQLLKLVEHWLEGRPDRARVRPARAGDPDGPAQVPPSPLQLDGERT